MHWRYKEGPLCVLTPMHVWFWVKPVRLGLNVLFLNVCDARVFTICVDSVHSSKEDNQRKCPTRSVLKTPHFRKSLKSKYFDVSEKSLYQNSLVNNVSHVLEVAMRKSKRTEGRRRVLFGVWHSCMFGFVSCLYVLVWMHCFWICVMLELLRSELLVYIHLKKTAKESTRTRLRVFMLLCVSLLVYFQDGQCWRLRSSASI